MTMAQAKCVPGWTYPDEKYYFDDATVWWYDDDGDGVANDSKLEFNQKGRLRE